MRTSSAQGHVCSGHLAVRPAQGRKTGKTFIMMICPTDGRHFRGFITDQDYVARITRRLQSVDAGVEES